MTVAGGAGDEGAPPGGPPLDAIKPEGVPSAPSSVDEEARELAHQERRIGLQERIHTLRQRGLYAKAIFGAVCLWLLVVVAVLLLEGFGGCGSRP